MPLSGCSDSYERETFPGLHPEETGLLSGGSKHRRSVYRGCEVGQFVTFVAGENRTESAAVRRPLGSCLCRFCRLWLGGRGDCCRLWLGGRGDCCRLCRL